MSLALVSSGVPLSIRNNLLISWYLVRNNLWDWQNLQPYSGGGIFFEFCDALEVKDGQIAPASGWGLDYALGAWGSFFSNTYLPIRRCLHRLSVQASLRMSMS